MLHPKVVLPALALLVLGVAGLAMLGAPEVLRAKDRYWLERHLESALSSGSQHERRQIFSKLLERLEAKRLPRSAVDIVLEHALEQPAKQLVDDPPPHDWIRLLGGLRQGGAIDQQGWQRYIERLLELLSGDELPFHYAATALRVLRDYLERDWLGEVSRRRLIERATEPAVRSLGTTSERAIELLRVAQRKGVIDEADWKRRIETLARFDFEVRPLRRQGYDLPVRFSFARTASSGEGIYEFHRRASSLTVDASEVPLSYGERAWTFEIQNHMVAAIAAEDLAMAQELGKHVVRVVATIEAIPTGANRTLFPRWEFEAIEEARFTTVRADAPTVALHTPSADDEEGVRDALAFESVEVWEENGRYGAAVVLHARLGFGSTPVDLSFEVHALLPGERVRLGSIFLEAVETPNHTRRGRPRLRRSDIPELARLFGELPTNVDLLLVPDRERPEHQVDCREIWGGELRIHDVPLIEVAGSRKR